MMKKIAMGDIYLIPFQTEHIPLFHTWRNDFEIMELSSPVLNSYSLEETEFFVKKAMLEARDGEHFIIMHSRDDKAIGYISLINIDYDNFSADCMIEIGEKEYWGKGLGAHAMELLMDYVFGQLNFNRLALQVFDFNTRAINMYKKLGFKEEGRREKAIFRIGEYYDIILMRMLAFEYKSLKMPLN